MLYPPSVWSDEACITWSFELHKTKNEVDIL